MSVRVCYLERSPRGLMLQSLRLVGQASDDSWPQDGAAASDAPAEAADRFEQAAAWLRSRLQGARSRDELELLCLDAEGAAAGWLTTPSDDPSVVAALARQGSDAGTSEVAATSSLIDHFAPSVLDSSIQPMAGPAANGSHPAPAVKDRKKKHQPLPPQRLGLLAAGDLPARMLMDALDRQGVRVGAVATIWHALAQAWDPATASATSADRAVASSSQLVGIVLADPRGRLHWCWSRAGRLRAAGAMRLRCPAPAPAPVGGEAQTPPATVISRDDASRLTGEWLSWAMQLSESPSRIVLVLPEGLAADASRASLSAAALGEELAARWPGIAVDAAVHEDPLGATLRRVVSILERTPPAAPEPGAALVALSNRPGRTHRSMHVWAAGALALVGLALAVAGWKFRSDARTARAAEEKWASAWRGQVEQVFPDALRPRPRMSPLEELQAELQKREAAVTLPAQAERAKPVMQELETLSLVLAAPTIELEEVRLDGATGVTVRAITATTGDAEALLEGFRRIGGSHLETWTMDIQPLPNQADKRKVRYEAKWAKEGT